MYFQSNISPNQLSLLCSCLTWEEHRKKAPNLSISHKEAFLTAVKAVMRKPSMLSIRHWENVQPTSATTNTLYIWKQISCFGVCYSEHSFKGICFRRLHSKTHVYIIPPGVSEGLTLWTMLTVSNREAISKPREKQLCHRPSTVVMGFHISVVSCWLTIISAVLSIQKWLEVTFYFSLISILKPPHHSRP